MEKKVAAETKKAENIIKAKITREEAILAKQREIDQKHAETEELKEEKAELMRRKERLFDSTMTDRLKILPAQIYSLESSKITSRGKS